MAAARRLRRAGLPLAAILPLVGCGPNTAINPVQWWHGLQGGAIAEQRPPPPNVDMPYPNLGSIPPKPAMPDPAARRRIMDKLAADRANARYEAKLMPIPNLPQANPPGFPGAQPPPDANAASATLEAVTAPPSAAGSAKRGAKQVTAGPASLPPSSPVSLGPMPAIPAAPPPPPRLAGVAIPVAKPRPFPVAPPEPAKREKLTAAGGAPVAVGFPPNSAVLSTDDVAALKTLAARRGRHGVEVIGFGDATDATPQVQAEGVDLALARARAMVAALTTEGVPAAAIRMSAQAGGRGGAARLID